MQLNPTGSAGYCLTSVGIKYRIRMRKYFSLVLLCPAEAQSVTALNMLWSYVDYNVSHNPRSIYR